MNWLKTAVVNPVPNMRAGMSLSSIGFPGLRVYARYRLKPQCAAAAYHSLSVNPHGTEAFKKSAHQRRKVEMLAHLKRHLNFRRLLFAALPGRAINARSVRLLKASASSPSSLPPSP
jgi:hypothetical protein